MRSLGNTLVFVEFLWVSLHLVWCWLLVSLILLLLFLSMGFVFRLFSTPFPWWCVEYCQVLFQHLMRRLCDFSLWVCLYNHLGCRIYIYETIPTYVGWSLSSRIFFLICSLIRFAKCYYFCIDIHKGNHSEVFFLCCIFVWFWYKHNYDFIEGIGKSSVWLYFVEHLDTIDIRCSVKDW